MNPAKKTKKPERKKKPQLKGFVTLSQAIIQMLNLCCVEVKVDITLL